MNLNIAYEPEFEQVVLKMPVTEGSAAKLADAVRTGVLQRGHYADWFTDEPGFFTDAIVHVGGKDCYLHINEDDHTLRFAMTPRNLNGLDHTEFKPDIDGCWVEFVQPLRKILEILQ